MVGIQHRFIDFHSHYFDAAWFPSPSPGSGPPGRAWPLLTDIDAQLAALSEAGIDAKVLTAPASALVLPGERLSADFIRGINDRMAELVAEHPDRLLALATIDAFQGDAAAHEVERAVQTLGFGGIVVDCAQGDRYLDAPEAIPALETAAALGATVFIHPVSPVGLAERLARYGHTGVLVARGTEDAVSVLALLRSGVFDALPGLNAVVPMIGASFFLFAGLADREYGREDGWRGSVPSETRKRLYVDTMGFDPEAIRFAVALLGAEHVLLGSDWPIMPIATRERVEQRLMAAGVTDAGDRAAILSGNTLHLLAGRVPSVVGSAPPTVHARRG